MSDAIHKHLESQQVAFSLLLSIVIESNHVLAICLLLVENRYEHRGVLIWFQTAQEPYCSSLDCWDLQNDIDLLWCTFLVGLRVCFRLIGFWECFSSDYLVLGEHL